MGLDVRLRYHAPPRGPVVGKVRQIVEQTQLVTTMTDLGQRCEALRGYL